MGTRGLATWLVLLALALVLFCSCESSGNYRVVNYRFGEGTRWRESVHYGEAPWGPHPGHPPLAPDGDGTTAESLPATGMPSSSAGVLDGFE